MTTAILTPSPRQKFWANDGTPLAYGKLYVYQAGSTTPATTYIDSTGTTTNTNPITLDARGECNIWILPNVLFKYSLFDSLGNQIAGYPIDNVGNQFLLTLYAGVDTGSPNAYVVNYSAPYQSYTQGNPVIYFVASNSNTGPSTINVNGLGVTSIVNPNGTPLTAGQIVNNQMTQIVWQGGQFILTSIGATAGLNIGTFGAEVSIASASTTDLGFTGTHTINVTGSSNINSLGTSASINAPIFSVRFSGTPTIVYNATSLITPTAKNIAVNAGDWMLAEYLGSGNWKILSYQSTGIITQTVARTTQATITSSTVITIDTQLQLPIPATGTYIIEGWINDATGTSAGGLNGEIAFTGMFLTGFWSSNGVGTSVTTVPLTAINTSAQMQSAQTGTASMPIYGSIQATTTGTLSFSWAQQASNATASLIGPGSFIQTTYVSMNAGTFIPQTFTFNTPVSGSQVIPVGATTMTIEVFGAAGGGGNGDGTFTGGGGGSGGYSKTIATVTGDGGQTIAYTVGTVGLPNAPGGNSIISSGTFSLTTMTCTGGGGGTFNSTTPGAGGTATGGTTTNTSGNAGTSGGSGGAGGAGLVGTYATGSTGGQGMPNYPGGVGLSGVIVFHFA